MAQLKPLRGLTITLAGDFGENFKHPTLMLLIQENGGRYSFVLDSNVTHLVCSRHAWKVDDPVVVVARREPNCEIVNIDWLLATCREQRRAGELWYGMQRADQKEDRKKRLRREVIKTAFEEKGYEEQFEVGSELARSHLGSDGYHVHRDMTGYLHSITLVRSDKENTAFHRWDLHLLEVNFGPPYYFATTADFRTYYSIEGGTTHTQPKVFHLAHMNSEYNIAHYAWRLMFRCLTGVDWEFRFWVTPNFRIIDSGLFQYTEGTSLHPLSPESGEMHRKLWEEVQAKSPSYIRRNVREALQGTFKKTALISIQEAGPSARRPATKKAKEGETGKVRAPGFDADLSSDTGGDEADGRVRVPVETHGNYFEFTLPRPAEPCGLNSMSMNGDLMFGPVLDCKRRCAAAQEDQVRQLHFALQAAARADPPRLKVGGGPVQHWDWRMFKYGFKGFG